MTIQVVGAGVGRTGTHSLKIALERLLGGTCHHMMEVFPSPQQQAGFTAAIDGEPTDWHDLLADFSAIVDFPGSFFWRELAAAFPDAPVLLSTRPAQDWYRSASKTIFEFRGKDDLPPEMQAWMNAVTRGFATRFHGDLSNEAAMINAYKRHNADVRTEIPADRLIDWTPNDGWAPICERLGLAIPNEPFPLTNTTAEFRARLGLDPSE